MGEILPLIISFSMICFAGFGLAVLNKRLRGRLEAAESKLNDARGLVEEWLESKYDEQQHIGMPIAQIKEWCANELQAILDK